MNKIKICGLTNTNDISLCNDLPIDFIGFNFYSKSKRFISIKTAETLIKNLSNDISKVGIFVNENVDTINHHIGELDLDYVQLHGDETPEEIYKLKCKTIKAFSALDSNLPKKVIDFDTDYWLFDSANKEERGGTGKTFDWSILSDISPKEKMILSGGINESNILDAINKTRINIIDVCSGVESSPGYKDVKKLESIVRLVKDV